MSACSRSASPPRRRTSRSIIARGEEAGEWRLETEDNTVDGGPANGDWGPEAGGREPMGGPAPRQGAKARQAVDQAACKGWTVALIL